ncbi:MAG: G5 domain-containing protein [Patescibacteria group bacterium]
MERQIALGLFLSVLVGAAIVRQGAPSVLSAEDKKATTPAVRSDFLAAAESPETKSEFKTLQEVVKKAIPFSVRYEDDPGVEWGEKETKQKGEDGQREEVFEVAYWYGRETGRRLVNSVVVKKPQEEIISLGKEKTIRTGEFARCGRVDYYGRMRVWATSYDKYCKGCLGVTYTGLPAGYGTVAVDPKVIPLYSRICIPGYGVAVAGDIGGAIKGDKIDLGFDNVKEGWWSARWTDIYLLP